MVVVLISSVLMWGKTPKYMVPLNPIVVEKERAEEGEEGEEGEQDPEESEEQKAEDSKNKSKQDPSVLVLVFTLIPCLNLLFRKRKRKQIVKMEKKQKTKKRKKWSKLR